MTLWKLKDIKLPKFRAYLGEFWAIFLEKVRPNHLGNISQKKNAADTKIFRPIWDRCYDFLNIFAENFGEKIGVFDLKQS
jgi:hypothetical protein